MTFQEKFASLSAVIAQKDAEARAYLVAIEVRRKSLHEEIERLNAIKLTAQALSHDWRASVPGGGGSIGWVWFFVRSIEIDQDGRPTYYDPFWARELVDDLAKAEARQPTSSDVACSLPYFAGPNVLGNLSEAVKARCPECGEETFVVGQREQAHWADGERRLYEQSLYIFCLKCPRLSRIAHRKDKERLDLHVRTPNNLLGVLHEQALSLGRVLASCLHESVRAQLNSLDGIEPLRHELRQASSLAVATQAEIRCAVAISEFALALEGLMLQDEKGPRQVLLYGIMPVQVGDEYVPIEYFVDRIADAISCEKQAVCTLFWVLIELLQKQIVKIPRFISTEFADWTYLDLDLSKK